MCQYLLRSAVGVFLIITSSGCVPAWYYSDVNRSYYTTYQRRPVRSYTPYRYYNNNVNLNYYYNEQQRLESKLDRLQNDQKALFVENDNRRKEEEARRLDEQTVRAENEIRRLQNEQKARFVEDDNRQREEEARRLDEQNVRAENEIRRLQEREKALMNQQLGE